MEKMEALIDQNTKGILINNPSNPCGSNFSPEHLGSIARLARKHGLPIIADEIYGGVVFEGEFSPMHCFSGDVPVISVGGLAKEFVCPGWRVGWVTIHDHGLGRLADVKAGIKSLSQIVLGANSLMQPAIERVLTPAVGGADAAALAEYSERYLGLLRANAELCVSCTAGCPELTVNQPRGAMYAMVHIAIDKLEGIADDADFARQLLVEENLFVLPGVVFGMIGYVRVITCPPAATIVEAFARMASFCERKRKVV